MLRRTVLLTGAALPFVRPTAPALAADPSAAAPGTSSPGTSSPGTSSPGTSNPGTSNPGTVDVLYAGSLVNLMERAIGPGFDSATNGRFQGYAGGSNKIANEVKGRLRRGDVFISANKRVNDDLAGAANGAWVSWYITFAQSPLVIGTSKSSRFAAALKTQPWYDVLRQPGVRIGRTDPLLDPKGQLTVALLDKAARLYHLPGLTAQVLGAPENPAQVFPEENLVGRLQSGQLDIGFFYATETTDLNIPAIKLPPETALGAQYTVTILHDAANPQGAARFIAYLLGPGGRDLMHRHGLDATPPTIGGDPGSVPAAIRSVLNAAQ
jgi:molybdate/tungstate transport system substrate-binding protein